MGRVSDCQLGGSFCTQVICLCTDVLPIPCTGGSLVKHTSNILLSHHHVRPGVGLVVLVQRHQLLMFAAYLEIQLGFLGDCGRQVEFRHLLKFSA